MSSYWLLLEMFLHFFAFFYLIEENNAGDQKIVECFVEVNRMARPSIPPENCHDLDSNACNTLFPKADPNTHADNANVYVQLSLKKFSTLS